MSASLKDLKIDLNNLDKSNWKTYRFDEIAKNISERVDPNNTDLQVYIGLEHIDSESLHIKRYGTPDDVNGTKLKFYKGDIIFGRRRAYQRKAGIATWDGFCSAHALVLRANSDVIYPELFPFFLHSDLFMNRAIDISVGSLSPTINWGTLKHQEFLIPPLEYQFELSKLLKANDETSESYKEVVKKLTMYKKSVMKEFFDGDLRLGNFKEVKELKRLDEIAKYRRGSFPQPYGSKEWYDEENGEPFVQVYDIDFDMRLKPKTKVKISKAACQKSVFAPKGTLIISIQGSIGRVAITQYDAYIDRTVLIFQEFLVDIDQLYFSYVLEDLFYKAEKTAPGATIKTITKEALSAFEVLLPCLDEQIAMGKIFKNCDTKVEEAKKVLSDVSSASSAIKNKVF